jgi:hypothetical protein
MTRANPGLRRVVGLCAAGLALAMLALVAPMGLFASRAAAAVPVDPYAFRNVAIGGGGYVPGVVFSQAQPGLAYARTDIGGMYRWNPATSSWVPLLDWLSWDIGNYAGVASVAASPSDADKVWAAVGMYTNDWDPNNGAVLRSDDKGDTWQATVLPFKIGGNMPGRGMGERLAVDPNNDDVLYLGAPSGKGLWRSTDGGVTWAQVTSFPNPGTYVQKPGDAAYGDNQGIVWVTFDQTTGSAGTTTRTIYVGVADKNNPVYRSTDGGATWAALAGAPTGYLPHKGVLDPVNHLLYIATSDTGGPFDGAKGDVWKYDTVTGAWTQISPIPSSSDDDYFGYSGLTVDRLHPSTIMVGTQVSWWPDAIIFRSTDSGATWTRIWDWDGYPNRSLRYTFDYTSVPWLTMGQQASPPMPSPKLGAAIPFMEIDPFDSDHMFFAGGAGISGTNNLTAWDTGGVVKITTAVEGLEETAVLGLIKPPGGALVSALGDVGGFRHDDLDVAPEAIFTSPIFTTTRSIDYAELNPNVIVRSGDFTDSDRPSDSHAAFSTDGGATWFQGTEPIGVNTSGTIAAAADGGRFVWAPGDSGQQVVHSVGFGTSWTASTGVPANAVVASDRVNPMKFYAYDNGTFYVSTDGGASFTATTASGLPNTSWGLRFKAVPGHEGDIWLAGSGSDNAKGLWHSTDSGATFTKVSTVDEADNIGFGKAAPGQTYPALYAFARVGGQRGIFRSDDAAASWVRINDDQHQWGASQDAITGDPDIYGRVYFSAGGRGIMYGDRVGTTPTPSASPSPSATVTPSPTVGPTSSPTTSPDQPGCRVTYTVAGSWQGGFQAGVKVTNTGGTAINGWRLTWTFTSGETITQLWNGSYTQTGPTVTVTSPSYGGTLAANGGSAEFGFLGSTSRSTNSPPSGFALNDAACTVT